MSDDEKYQQGWHDAIEKQREQKPIEKPTKGNYYTCIKNYQFCEHDDVTFEMGKIYKCEEDGKITADNGGLWSFSNIIGFFRLSTHEEILNHLQKPVEMKSTEESLGISSIVDADKNWELVEQKWSKEDDEYLQDAINYFNMDDGLQHSTKDFINWLKSLKERIGG